MQRCVWVRVPSGAPARRKRHIACDEFFHFIAKLIARSFCCSFLPKRTRCTGFAVGRPPCGRHFSPLRNVNFNRTFQKRLIFIRKMDTARGLDYGRYRATGAQFGGERKERAVPLSEQVPASPGGWPNRIYQILTYRRFHSILIKIVSPGVVSRAQAYMPCTTRSG